MATKSISSLDFKRNNRSTPEMASALNLIHKLNMPNNKPFKSDTAKLVERHLKDPNHQITEEEIRNVRVGMTPPEPDDLRSVEERAADRKKEDEDETLPGSQAITPWDTLDED
jgi:hypothetical protein